MQHTLHREEFLFGAPNAREAWSRPENIPPATVNACIFFATDRYYEFSETSAIYILNYAIVASDYFMWTCSLKTANRFLNVIQKRYLNSLDCPDCTAICNFSTNASRNLSFLL